MRVLVIASALCNKGHPRSSSICWRAMNWPPPIKSNAWPRARKLAGELPEFDSVWIDACLRKPAY